jgi:DNA-binding GntR family transcriptional regulator
MISCVVDPHAPEPLRDQAAALIRRWIETGSMARLDWLPSEASMAQEFGVSKDTLRRALVLLRDEGLIESRRGRGWFVR